MAPVPFHYVDFRAFSYATEDETRVASAIQTFLPDGIELERTVSEGHNGDRIVVLTVRLERADEMRHVLSQVASIDDVDDVIDELDGRIDDGCSFFLTFDKQAALDGKVCSGDGITMRAKVEAYPATHENAVKNARDVFDSI